MHIFCPSVTDLAEIAEPQTSGTMLTAAHVQGGPPIDPLTRLLVYNSDEWEAFILEWASSLKAQYLKVLRCTGAGDRGIDIAGFKGAQLLNGVWDNYQCKHHDKPIAPHIAWPEIGKILWHSFNKHYVPPRAYYFVAPKETSTMLTLLLANANNLKAQLITVWNKSVRDEIGAEPVPLAGDFAADVKHFDFSIFKPKSLHRRYFSRFSGRPKKFGERGS